METCRMEFSGKLLKRGFWLYIWDIREDRRQHLYVGRTGDSSSPNASSPFRRIGQHLDLRINAKGNALLRQLKTAGIDAETCTFEMTAIGPIFEEQETMKEHIPLRDKTAALEKALADELDQRGYTVLGTHPRKAEPDSSLLNQVIIQLETSFPRKRKTSEPVQVGELEEVTPLQIQQCCVALGDAEKAGKAFIALKWFRDEALTKYKFDWTATPESRQQVLAKAIEGGMVRTSRIPNPKAPQHPTTTVALNRVEAPQGLTSRFNPIPVRGEPVSVSMMRDRGSY